MGIGIGNIGGGVEMVGGVGREDSYQEGNAWVKAGRSTLCSYLGKNLLGGRISRCKGPEVGRHLDRNLYGWRRVSQEEELVGSRNTGGGWVTEAKM